MSRHRWPAAALVAAVVLVGVVRVGVVTTVRQGTAGMEPTLQRGDVLLVSRLSTPVVGDVVLVRFPGESAPTLKRLVAQGPADVQVGSEGLVVNGEPARTGTQELRAVFRQGCTRVELPAHEEQVGSARYFTLGTGPAADEQMSPGALWLLGDHRAGSSDARQWGVVGESEVEGVVVARLWAGGPCG